MMLVFDKKLKTDKAKEAMILFDGSQHLPILMLFDSLAGWEKAPHKLRWHSADALNIRQAAHSSNHFRMPAA